MELVAAGNTNREIAAKLYLSVRTVDRHASRIFEKRAAPESQYVRARAGGPRPVSLR
jgi:DNA-binding NarL/FixJ family response regulator